MIPSPAMRARAEELIAETEREIAALQYRHDDLMDRADEVWQQIAPLKDRVRELRKLLDDRA